MLFRSMFYEARGFYGEDLKLAKLEDYIDSLGKTQDVYGTSCIGCSCQQSVWSQSVVYRDTLVPNPWDSV